jgi:hypothetical protein
MKSLPGSLLHEQCRPARELQNESGPAVASRRLSLVARFCQLCCLFSHRRFQVASRRASVERVGCVK